ncbi:MAG TPA: multicopper oxidase family protein [Acidimicrobiales bacterium]|nr:multicopper oxidase family protein [Acidimicrobiales bacterium]
MAMSRRQFLALAGAGTAGLALASCTGGQRRASPVPASGPEVAAAEEARRRPGAAVRDFAVTAAPLALDLGGGVRVETWGYGPTVPGSEVRIKAGEVMRARFTNRLLEPTTIHWHGIALRNDMDGVPGMTQPVVAPGATFDYEFTAPDPGTFWFHPHVGLHLDRGLYSPLIVEDPAEPGRYDREYVVVLDDWTDGLGQSPEMHLEDLRAGRGPHAAHQAGGGPHSEFLDSAGGDVNYALYLINGRHPEAPVEFTARKGERIRFRMINAGADTPFRVALGGHQMTVTHTDGFPVEPVTVDALMIAMAERYDVTVTVAGDGVYPLVAVAEAKADEAMAVLRSGAGDVPPSSVRPAELNGRILTRADLVATESVRLPAAKPDRTYKVSLGGGDEGYVWTLNGKPHGENEPLDVRQGERVRLDFENTTTMFHPMHLHGHTFQVVNPGGRAGARKDTAIVRPDEPLSVEFLADNPGQWMIHCHNNYHQEGGMMLTLSYVTDRPLDAQERASGLGLVCDWLSPKSVG